MTDDAELLDYVRARRAPGATRHAAAVPVPGRQAAQPRQLPQARVGTGRRGVRDRDALQDLDGAGAQIASRLAAVEAELAQAEEREAEEA